MLPTVVGGIKRNSYAKATDQLIQKTQSADTSEPGKNLNDKSNKEDRKRVVLEAAVKRLVQAQIEWMKGLTLDELHNDTGIDKGDISRDFGGKPGLTQELIAFALTPDESSFVIEDANRAVEALLDSEVDLKDSIERIGAADDAYHDANELLRAQMAIWALSSASDQTSRDQLKGLYQYFDSEHLVAWNALLDELSDAGITPTSGLSSEEFVAILSAVTEGTAIRAAVVSELRPRGLTSKALMLLFEAMLKLPGEEAELGAKLAELDRLRRDRDRDR